MRQNLIDAFEKDSGKCSHEFFGKEEDGIYSPQTFKFVVLQGLSYDLKVLLDKLTSCGLGSVRHGLVLLPQGPSSKMHKFVWACELPVASSLKRLSEKLRPCVNRVDLNFNRVLFPESSEQFSDLLKLISKAGCFFTNDDKVLHGVRELENFLGLLHYIPLDEMSKFEYSRPIVGVINSSFYDSFESEEIDFDVCHYTEGCMKYDGQTVVTVPFEESHKIMEMVVSQYFEYPFRVQHKVPYIILIYGCNMPLNKLPPNDFSVHDEFNPDVMCQGTYGLMSCLKNVISKGSIPIVTGKP